MKTLFLACAALLLSFTTQAQVKPGDSAPAFTLKNVDGKMVSLADYAKEKGVIVVFTCNHCPFSQKYEERIIALHKRFAAEGYPVVAINPNDAKKEPDDSYERMQARAKDKGYRFAYLHDESQAAAHAYGAARTPHVFLLSNNGGAFKVAYIGAIDDNANEPTVAKKHYIEEAITQLKAGRQPEPAKTSAIGCTIKWRES